MAIFLRLTNSSIVLSAFLMVFLMTATCMSVDSRLYIDTTPEQRRTTETLEVVYETPETPHKLIGELSIRYNSGYERSRILNRLKKEAAEKGGDGIIMQQIQTSSNMWQINPDDPSYYRDDLSDGTYIMRAVIYRYL